MPEYVEGVQYPFVHRAAIALEMATTFIWATGTQFMVSEGMEPKARILTSLAVGAISSVGAGVAVDRGVRLAHAFLHTGSERQTEETFSQEPDKYVPPQPDADETIKRLGRRKK